MAGRNRFRKSIQGRRYVGVDYYRYNGVDGSFSPHWDPGGQITLMAHCGDQTNPGPPYRSGGPVWITKYEWDPIIQCSGDYKSTGGWRYRGGFLPGQIPNGSDPTFNMANLPDMLTYGNRSQWNSWMENHDNDGAAAYNKYKPGKPEAGLAVFLGELREMPRMLSDTANFFHKSWKSAGGDVSGWTPKHVANDWLAANFGWVPFLSDVRKFVKLTKNLDNRLQRIKRDNGRWVKSGGSYRTAQSNKLVVSRDYPAHAYGMLTGFYAPGKPYGNHTIDVERSTEVWFEGSFRYWIPDIESTEGRMRTMAWLYGGMPTPSALWQLLPWSWLVDWCSNTGKIISNLETGYADNLASSYAYTMGTTKLQWKCSSTANLLEGPIHASWNSNLSWKTRLSGGAFGFALSPSSFTARQLSLLAALGLQRS